MTIWVHRFLSCRDLLDIPPLPASAALPALRHSAAGFGNMAGFLPKQEMPLPRRVLRSAEAAEPLGGSRMLPFPAGRGVLEKDWVSL